MKQMITRWEETPNGLRRKQNGKWVSFDDYVQFVGHYQKQIKRLVGKNEKIKDLKKRIEFLENLVRKYQEG